MEEGEDVSRAKAMMHPVVVVATKGARGNYEFRPQSDLWDEAEQEFAFHKDRHGMSKQDYHLIEFVLDDRTGDGLRFPNVPHDAMWVMQGADRANRQCPDMHTPSNYDVMEPICVCDEQKRLIVRNDNPRKEDWAFTLNFVKPGEDQSDRSRYVNWDPGGANHDGGV
jgi:hypothetical protein